MDWIVGACIIARREAVEPALVGFSVFMGYKLERALDLSRLVKAKRPDLPVLWGGVHPSMLPEETLREPSVDWVCLGPGETTIVALADALAANGALEEVPSLGRRLKGAVVLNPPGLPRVDENVCRPDWDSFPVERFIFGEKPGENIIGFVSSRGCPHDCGFCYNAGFHGRKWQPAPLQLVHEEMLGLRARFGVNGCLFLDDLFFANRRRATALLRWMGEHGFSCHGVDLRVDETGPDVLEALQAAGTKSLFIGVESTVDRVLKLARYPEIRLWLSCIVGFPTETFDEMQGTINDVAGLARRPNTIVNLNAFIPLPGTGLYDLAVEHGFAAPQDLTGWSELAEARASSLVD